MQFGRSEYPAKCDFKLPVDHPDNHRILKRSQMTDFEKPLASLGIPVWTAPELKGRIYPRGTKSKDYLTLYSNSFNSVELNSTFYTMPGVHQIERWRSAVDQNPDFLFYPKVPRLISENLGGPLIPGLWRQFLSTVEGLESHLGMMFLQLHPGFSPADSYLLNRFLTLIPKGLPLAIEFRHPEWFFTQLSLDAIAKELEEKDIALVISDTNLRRDVVHMRLSAPKVNIRFNGNALHATDYERLNAWALRLGDWTGQGLKQFAFFIHQIDMAQGVELSYYFAEKLNQVHGIQLRLPKLLEMEEEISEIEPQLNLF